MLLGQELRREGGSAQESIAERPVAVPPGGPAVAPAELEAAEGAALPVRGVEERRVAVLPGGPASPRIEDMFDLWRTNMEKEWQRKFDAYKRESDATLNARITEIRAQMSCDMVDFEINRFSERKNGAIFSAETPKVIWGHDWWLKVEKADERIGLYLCCGEKGRFPISVDYQLMARKRTTDDAVCASVVFRTEFGREKAWGLSRLTTLEQLTREGAYNPEEDKITFGVLIFPARGLQWGIRPRRPTAH